MTPPERPGEELAVGALLTFARTWRAVSIEPQQLVTDGLPIAGSCQLAPVLELVTLCR